MANMVTYYKNDGSGETAIGIGTTASQVCYITSVGKNAVDWSENGYYFVEWNTSADGTGTSYMPGDSNSTATQLYAIWQADLSYLTKSSDLTSIADAIRTKGGTSAPLVYPTGFVSAINDISAGGGGATHVTSTATIANYVYLDEDGSTQTFSADPFTTLSVDALSGSIIVGYSRAHSVSKMQPTNTTLVASSTGGAGNTAYLGIYQVD